MNIEDTNAIAGVIRENGFYFQSKAVNALADLFESRVDGFSRQQFIGEIQSTPSQPKTGEKCGCRYGLERDNCPRCEGTGWKIDFKKIRSRHQT